MHRTPHRDIALALSGGGYRAALFHLGVLSRLEEFRLLDRVGVFSCVSGGSILAGLYATSLLANESFPAFRRRALEFFNRPRPLDWPAMLHDLLPWSRSSRGLVRALERAMSADGRPIRLGELSRLPPRFVFNATAVHSGAGWRFLSSSVAEHWDLGFTHGLAFEPRSVSYSCDVTLGTAVAASAAFPTFSAVVIPSAEFTEIAATSPSVPGIDAIVPPFPRRLPPRVVLSDGGVLDNLGGSSVLAGQTPPEAPEAFYMIVSDGGQEVPVQHDPPRGRLLKLRYLMRQFALRGTHNNQMTALLMLSHYRAREEMATKGYATFRIDRAVPHAGEDLEYAQRLARVPTRLCRVSADLANDLITHGGNLAWTRLTEYTDLLSPDQRMPGATRQRLTDSAQGPEPPPGDGTTRV